MIRPPRALRLMAGGAEAAGFGAVVVFIAAVSVHDAALVALNEQVIAEVEQNPLGRWLILLSGNVWLFIGMKLLGTSVACATLVAIYRQWQSAAWAVAGAVACFQFGLLLYLSLR